MPSSLSLSIKNSKEVFEELLPLIITQPLKVVEINPLFRFEYVYDYQTESLENLLKHCMTAEIEYLEDGDLGKKGDHAVVFVGVALYASDPTDYFQWLYQNALRIVPQPTPYDFFNQNYDISSNYSTKFVMVFLYEQDNNDPYTTIGLNYSVQNLDLHNDDDKVDEADEGLGTFHTGNYCVLVNLNYDGRRSGESGEGEAGERETAGEADERSDALVSLMKLFKDGNYKDYTRFPALSNSISIVEKDAREKAEAEAGAGAGAGAGEE